MNPTVSKTIGRRRCGGGGGGGCGVSTVALDNGKCLWSGIEEKLLPVIVEPIRIDKAFRLRSPGGAIPPDFRCTYEGSLYPHRGKRQDFTPDFVRIDTLVARLTYAHPLLASCELNE